MKTAEFELLLGKVFDKARCDLRRELEQKGLREQYEKIRNDFIFHMMDWADDAERLHALAESPGTWTTEKATRFLIGFVYHVIPHLDTAGRLLVDEVNNPFVNDESLRLVAASSEGPPAGK